MRWGHQAESGRPNNRKPEGQILFTIRPNRKAKFDRKAENTSSLISAQYINIFICSNNHLVYHDVLIEKVEKFERELLYLIIWPSGKI